MQEALTTIFGFGILTLATIALLNVACMRLHEVQKMAAEASRFAYAYVYDGPKAHTAREDLRSLPSLLVWTGFVAIAMVQVLHLVAYSTSGPATAVLNAVTWMSIVSYVLVLLAVAAVVSNRVYGAMAEVNLG